MIFVHRETSEVYEMRMVTIDEEVVESNGVETFGINKVVLLGKEPVGMTYREMAEELIFIGWL